MIKINLQELYEPKPIILDSRGTKIESLLKIAFNKSGNVIIGTIQEIKKNEWVITRPGTLGKFWWRLRFEMIVKDENGLISKIKNPNSFIII